MSVLNTIVSYYPSVTATEQGVDVNLLDLLRSNKHKDAILNLRQSDESVQKYLKEKLPCYVVGGRFSRRCKEGLIQSSGLAGVDLDSAENYDAIYLLNELKKIDCIAYAGLSCRGKRLFCIVPFKYPDKYEKHYERLLQSFLDMGLPMGDDCHKIISQPRFVSWNDGNTQFFNHTAKPYPLLPAEKTYHTLKRNYHNTGASNEPANPFRWCVEQINKSHSFNEGTRHQYILHLARYCNLKGIAEYETLNGCREFIQPDFPETEIESIVHSIYTKQIDSHAKLPFAKSIRSDYSPPRHMEQAKSSLPENDNTDAKENMPLQMIEDGSELPEQSLSADNQSIAYVDNAGKLYIPTPMSDTYTVRDSIEAYNKRTGDYPCIKKTDIDITSFKVVFIDRNTLTIPAND